MGDKWNQIKDFIVPDKPVDIQKLSEITGLSRATIRRLLDKHTPGTKRSKMYIDWILIEEDIRSQQNSGIIDNDVLVEKYGLAKSTLQSYLRYKMGLTYNGDPIRSGVPQSLADTSLEELMKRSIDIKRQNLGLYEDQMKRWLNGNGGKEYMEYLTL